VMRRNGRKEERLGGKGLGFWSGAMWESGQVLRFSI
jgi:hypothetical protein